MMHDLERLEWTYVVALLVSAGWNMFCGSVELGVNGVELSGHARAQQILGRSVRRCDGLAIEYRPVANEIISEFLHTTERSVEMTRVFVEHQLC